MIILTGHLLFETKQDRDRVVEESGPIQAVTRRWPGCLEYCFAADPADDLRLVVTEMWVDGAALRAHFTHDDYAQMRAVLNSGGRDHTQDSGFPQVHSVAASMPVYDEHREPWPSYFEE